jgi:DNA polymerase-1
MSRFYLIDGNSQMYRAYHAIRDLTGPDGRSTNAVYGFVTMLRKLISKHKPDYIAAAFDVSGPTFRTEIEASYKANRPEMPEDLVEQVPLVHESCRALGVPVLTLPGYEADDLIGTLTERATEKGMDVVIVTGDKDLFQLVCNSVKVYNPKDNGTWYDAVEVQKKFGVKPSQVVDVLALMGDSSDNIKGVPGIGKKGARELITTYGSLEDLLSNVAIVTKKKHRNSLLEHADDARLSQELARIQTNVPIKFDIKTSRYRGAKHEQCFELFSSLGFHSLLTDFVPTAETATKDYQLICSKNELKTFVAQLRTHGQFAIRVICDSQTAMRTNIVGFSLSKGTHQARYIPLRRSMLDSKPQLSLPEAIEILKPILEDKSIAKLGHDLKFDFLVLARHGVRLQGIEADTMLASYLFDSTQSTHQLENIAPKHITYRPLKEEDVCGRGTKAINLNQVPSENLLDYACERSDLALQLVEYLHPKLKAKGLEHLYHDLEIPLIPVLADIQRVGVRIDTISLSSQAKFVEKNLNELTAQIFEISGETFNIGSPKQLAEILFVKLKLPTIKRTGKTRSASTAVDVLEELALIHGLPQKILEWRILKKLKSTYLDALPKLINPDTNRIHTSFNQAVATTGRLSSSDPNLQNIPIRTDLGLQIRSAFIADPNHVLISADYSQIELRVLAHLSNDENLIEAFKTGKDIHDQTAFRIFGTDSGLNKHELRRRAKIVNYSLIYGKTAFTLAKDIGVSQQDAQAFIDAYFEEFPGVRKFINATIVKAREQGVVTTMFGRRRPVPELNSLNGQIRAATERAAVNMPIQGTAADILKMAMISLHQDLKKRASTGLSGCMILTVHDELLIEVRENEAEEVASIVRTRMEEVVSLNVPMIVNVGIGKNWKEAKS